MCFIRRVDAVSETPGSAAGGSDATAIPFGYSFGVSDDGSPTARDHRGHWDAFTLWLEDNADPSSIAEQLAAIGDVVAGNKSSHRSWHNDSIVRVGPEGFTVRLTLKGLDTTPHLEGSTAQLQLLLTGWVEHLNRIGSMGDS